MTDHLLAATEEILAANVLDMEAAKGKISDVMLDRLYLDASRIQAMATGIRDVVALPDPIGEVLKEVSLKMVWSLLRSVWLWVLSVLSMKVVLM